MNTLKNWSGKLRDFGGLLGSIAALVWRSHPAYFVLLLLLQLLQGMAPLATAWIMKSLFDLLGQSLGANAPAPIVLQRFVPLLAAQFAFVVISQLIQPATAYLNGELTRRLTFNVQHSIYQKINRLTGLAPFEDPRFHDTIQLAAQGAQFGPQQILSILSALIQNVTTLLAFVSVLILLDPMVAIGVTIAVLPQLFIQIKMGHRRFNLAAINTPKERRAWYYGHVLSAEHFAKEIRLFDMGAYFLRAFEQVTGQIHAAQRSQQSREVGWQALLSLISGIVSASIFTAIAVQALSGRLSLGDITLYLSAVGSVQAALSSIVSALASGNESLLFHTRYTELQALPQPLALSLMPRKIPRLMYGIELRNVSFRYSESHPWILCNVSLLIPAGQCVALVGLNGAGKTTLVKLLARLYDPTEGVILWDGIDLREFDPHDLRRAMGAVFQDFGRYELSARENIGLGDVHHNHHEERVPEAARQAGIHERIIRLPQGYETTLSRWLADDDQGVDLSGGEWQKIAIARMLMRDADFLMLDEPTAALDAEAEYEVYQHFTQLMQGRTTLLISHRFSTVAMADRIAVLENGQINQGSHEELYEQGGTYARLYALQAERYQRGYPAAHIP